MSHEMTLSLFNPWESPSSKTGRNISNQINKEWLRVGESGINESGLGLIALHTFHKDDIISVYIGKICTNKKISVYALEHLGVTIDPSKLGTENSNPLLMGAHFCNDHDWCDRESSNRRQNNAWFDGLYLRAKIEIKNGVEICVA